MTGQLNHLSFSKSISVLFQFFWPFKNGQTARSCKTTTTWPRILIFVFFSAAIVIGAFLGCYLPIVVASLVHMYAGETPSCSLGQTLEILLFLTFSNTVLNPLIYSLRNHEYRRAFKKIFKRCRWESDNSQRLRLNYVKQDLESLTVSSHVTSNHVNTS